MNNHPFIKLTPFVAGGILLADSINYSASHQYIFLLICIGALLLVFKYKKPKTAVLLVIIQLIGIGLLIRGIEIKEFKTTDNLSSGYYNIIGLVEEVKTIEDRVRIHILTRSIQKQTTLEIKFNILVYGNCEQLRQIKKGQELMLKNIRLKDINKSWNTGYISWLEQKKVKKVIHLSTCSHISQIRTISTNSFQKKNKQIKNILQKLYPEPIIRGIMEALILGDKSNIDMETKDAYIKTGAIHILAISGLHVGLIFSVPFFLIRLFTNNRFIVYSGSMLVIILFTILTGVGPSVARASCMLGLFSIGKICRKNMNVLNILFTTAMILSIIRPSIIYQIGFQLSFFAVFGIINYQHHLKLIWRPKFKLTDYIWQLNVVSIAAQIGTLGLSLYHFAAFSLLFPLSGLIVIPLAPIILIVGMSSVGLYPINTSIAELLANFNTRIISFQNHLLTEISQLDGLYLRELHVGLLDVIMYYSFIICFAFSHKKLSWLKIILALLFMICFSVSEKKAFSVI